MKKGKRPSRRSLAGRVNRLKVAGARLAKGSRRSGDSGNRNAGPRARRRRVSVA
jgi:hypothetical protein